MKHIYITLLAVSCISFAAMAENVAKQFNQFTAPNSNAASTELVAVGVDNSIYMVGQFTAEFDFAGKTLTPIDAGSTYILKYSATGEPVWAAYVKGAATPAGVVVAGDKIVIAIQAKGDQEIFSAQGDVTSVDFVDANAINTLLLSLNVNGQVVWNRKLDAESVDENELGSVAVNSLKLAANGNLVFVATLRGKVQLAGKDFASKLWNMGQDEGWGMDFFVVKPAVVFASINPVDGVDIAATSIYAKEISLSDVSAGAATLASNGDLIISCTFYGTIYDELKSKEWTANFESGGNYGYGIITARIGANSTIVWDKPFLFPLQGGTVGQGYEYKGYVNHISMLTNDKISIAGTFEGELPFSASLKVNSAGKSDFYVAQADPTTGAVEEAHSFGGVENESSLCAISGGNTLYLAGGFAGKMEFPAGDALFTFAEATDITDGFLVKYEYDSKAWSSARFGGELDDKVAGIALTSAGNVVLSGMFKATDAAKANFFGRQVVSSLVDGNPVYDSYLLVTGENNAPVANGTLDNATVRVGEQLTVNLPTNLFTDADGDDLTLSVTLKNGASLPVWLAYNANAGTISGTPTKENVGTIELKVTATDAYSLSASVNFAITIEASTGIGDNTTTNWRVYPTYATTHINLENVVSAKLYSLVGVMVKEVVKQNSISVSGLCSGVYMLQVEATNGDKRVVRVFVK